MTPFSLDQIRQLTKGLPRALAEASPILVHADIGDGGTASGTLTSTHVYGDNGVYTVTITITDDDGVGTSALEIIVKPIPATIDCDSDTLNLNSNGEWLTCYIELPQGYDVWQIDGSTVYLNGVVPAELNKQGWAKAESNESNITDDDNDGVLERMVKFDHQAVQEIFTLGEAVILTVTGKVSYNDGLADFESSDIIRVIDKGKR